MMLLLLLVASAALVQGYAATPAHALTASQIGMAKKQCQQNCHHVPSNGRNRVLHNRCVQTCWNEFFASMMKEPQHHPLGPPKSGPHTAGPVMRNVPKGSKNNLLNIIAANNKHAKAVLAQRAARARGMPVDAAFLAVPALLLAALLAAVM